MKKGLGNLHPRGQRRGLGVPCRCARGEDPGLTRAIPSRPDRPDRLSPDEGDKTMRTRHARLAAASLLSLATAATGIAAMAGPVAAGASVFRVNTTGDKGDGNLGDGVCDTTPSPS